MSLATDRIIPRHAAGVSVDYPTQLNHIANKRYVDAAISGSLYTGTSPITVSGGVISMTAAGPTQSGYVTTGTQSIAGVKTFVGLPTIPLTPSANTDAASKGYVDLAVSSGGGVTRTNIIYWGAGGSDSNSGLNPGAPVLTLEHALDLVPGTASDSDRYVIYCDDMHTESLSTSGTHVLAHTSIYAPCVTLVGGNTAGKYQVAFYGGRQMLVVKDMEEVTINMMQSSGTNDLWVNCDRHTATTLGYGITCSNATATLNTCFYSCNEFSADAILVSNNNVLYMSAKTCNIVTKYFLATPGVLDVRGVDNWDSSIQDAPGGTLLWNELVSAGTTGVTGGCVGTIAVTTDKRDNVVNIKIAQMTSTTTMASVPTIATSAGAVRAVFRPAQDLYFSVTGISNGVNVPCTLTYSAAGTITWYQTDGSNWADAGLGNGIRCTSFSYTLP